VYLINYGGFPLLLSEESGWGYFGNRQLMVGLNWKETNQSKRKAIMTKKMRKTTPGATS
jgi:hypothetical protein